MDRHVQLFNRIAPVYSLFFSYQVKMYTRILDANIDLLCLETGARILDIGCGSGAMASCLANRGFNVTAVDASPAMVNQASRNLARFSPGKTVTCLAIDHDQPMPFPDGEFDLVISCYVAHGLQRGQRVKLYREGMRLAREGKMIIHDYNERRGFFSDIVEYLERGDYFYFIKHALDEMRELHPAVTKIGVDRKAAWYLFDLSYCC
jgi:ubiquinone/menaquinone biosynthesis C-methylase UbiE